MTDRHIERKEYHLSEDARSLMKGQIWIGIGIVALIALVSLLTLLWDYDGALKQDNFWEAMFFFMLLMLLFAALSFFGLRSKTAAVAVDAHSIQYCRSKKSADRLRWEDIDDIKVHPFLPYIQLHSRTTRPAFLLSYHLKDVQEILQLLQKKTQPMSLPATFHKVIPRRIVVLSVILFIFTAYIDALHIFFAVGGMFIFFGTIHPYRQDPRLRLVVTPTGFQLHRRHHISTTAFSTVTAVELRPTSDPSKAFYQHTVMVSSSDGETLDVCPFGCDPFAVYWALQTGWQKQL